MADWRVPFADVVVADEDIAAVADAYRSGRLTMGPRTERFEREFADYVGAQHAVAVSSATAGIHLLALAAGLGPDDEVVLPSMTFVATASAVAATGATPVFADIASPTEPWLSPSSVEAAITERTRAVMAVSYGGHPGEIAALAELCERRGLVLLEDAAHAPGSRLGSRHLGTFGAGGAFSFFSNKNLPVGEAGMVVTGDAAVAERVRSLRSWGVTGSLEGYDVTALGFNYRIDEPRAAMGLARLGRLDGDNRRRGEIVAAYLEAFAGLPEVAMPMAPLDGATLSHHLFTLVLPDRERRDDFRAELARCGVETSVHFPPVHRFSYYRASPTELPFTDEYSSRTVSLPLFPHMGPEQLELVIRAARAATPA